jgi:hypothetical protein
LGWLFGRGLSGFFSIGFGRFGHFGHFGRSSWAQRRACLERLLFLGNGLLFASLFFGLHGFEFFSGHFFFVFDLLNTQVKGLGLDGRGDLIGSITASLVLF